MLLGPQRNNRQTRGGIHRAGPILFVAAVFSLTACDEGAMHVLSWIGKRPDFELTAAQNGRFVHLNASAGKKLVDYDEESPSHRTELYQKYDESGANGPYGQFDVIYEGYEYEWDIELPAPGTYYYRVGMVEVGRDTVEYRSTAVTVTWP